ncbi:MAG: GNAT family N-acetyltransferase [Microbacter sp.]
MQAELIIREITYHSTEYDMELKLRDAVLRQPLGMSIYRDPLAFEKDDFHLGAFLNERLVGTLILTPVDNNTLRMRQVAVDQNMQRRKIGTQLVRFAEKIARQKGYNVMKLHARKSAVSFYSKLGYETVGDEFKEINLPHFVMQKRLR